MKATNPIHRADVALRQADAPSKRPLLLASVCMALASPALATEGNLASTVSQNTTAPPSLQERMESEQIMNELLLRTEPPRRQDAERRATGHSRLTGESANYRVHWDVAPGAGGTSASASYGLVATLGQAAASGFSSSASYGLEGGFLSPPDSDEDGLRNFIDNCLADANTAQVDADADGFGNVCDADFNNDCIVNAADLFVLRSVFFTTNAEADLNTDNVVNTADLVIFRARFFSAPGPSGIDNVCVP